jgi:hypothetical protein
MSMFDIRENAKNMSALLRDANMAPGARPGPLVSDSDATHGHDS